MNALQVLDLQASLMTMLAHGLPAVPSTPLPTTLSPNLRERLDATTTSAIDTILKVANEASGVLKDIPYVKAVAGTVVQIMQMKEEFQTEETRCQELIVKVVNKSNLVLGGLLKVAASPDRSQLKGMESNLKQYKLLLEDILKALKAHASANRATRILNRSESLERVAYCNRLISDFDINFIINCLIELAVNPRQYTQHELRPPTRFFPPALPTPGKPMIGRDNEQSEIVDTLLHRSPPHVAILGAGGIGKTTLALAALYDPSIIVRYPSRYFVSCAAVQSVPTFLYTIADVLRLPPGKRDGDLINNILLSIPQNAILCVDNFETIWEIDASRAEVEDILAHLSCVPGIAIMVTMRGTQRPSTVSWSKPLLPALGPLSEESSKKILETMDVKTDEFVERLLKAVDGIPLAITLIGSLLEEGNETSRSLWARWEQTKTEAIESGGKDRLSNLDTSIQLSVYGLRMQADSNNILVLAMLSFLPDGLPDHEDTLNGLQSHLPENIPLRKALLTLRRVSLVHENRLYDPPRLQMLSPIRHFCLKHLPTPQALIDGVIHFYTKMLEDHADYRNAAAHRVIPPELPNMHAIFVQAYDRGRNDTSVVMGSISFTRWSLYIGKPVEEVMHLSLQHATTLALRAKCHSTLGDVFMQQDRPEEAEASFVCAVELERETQDIQGEANDVHNLGNVYTRRGKLDEAVESFTRAIKLHRKAHSVLGEANDINKLGVVYMHQTKLDEAEESFTHAIELHKKAHDVLGEADDVLNIGIVYMQHSKPEEAEKSFMHAVKLHRKAHDVLGEANDLPHLGLLYMQQGKLDEAEESFMRAIELHRKAHSVLGEAHDVGNLGVMYMQQMKLDEAEKSFTRAIELHRKAHDVHGEANDVQKLGEVYMRREKLHEAEQSFKHATELHRKAHDGLGEANDALNLGVLYMQQDKFGEAEESFMRAIELHRKVPSVPREANDVQNLGVLYMRQEKFDEAEASFMHAIELHREAHDVLGEANDVQFLGQVCMRQNKSDEAETFFVRAAQLFQQMRL